MSHWLAKAIKYKGAFYRVGAAAFPTLVRKQYDEYSPVIREANIKAE